MKPVIELKHLTKMYGSVRGIEDVSLKVEKGAIFGFLGPNGAGKTTTISMMVNLLRPTNGKINLFGKDNSVDNEALRARIGFLAGDMALDRGLRGIQELEYLGNLRGSFDKQYVLELADRLNCDLNRKFKTLSRGNKQKVGLISALMHKPELLILDEPTSGLDPLVQAEFNKIILEHQKNGGTAFISSHVLSEVQELCDRVAFIREGKIIADTTLTEIVASAPKQVRLAGVNRDLKSKLEKLDEVADVTWGAQSASFTYQGDINLLLKFLGAHKLKDATISEVDLETTFMKFYEAKDA